MAKPARNELHLETCPGGGFRLFGYFQGRRIRRRSPDLAPLESEKLRLERQLVEIERHRPELRLTHLDAEQLRQAEAGVTRAAGRWPLARIIDRGLAALECNADDTPVEPHFESWLVAMQPTLGHRWLLDIIYRGRAFFADHPRITFSELTRESVHRWLTGLRCSGQTRANHRAALSRYFADLVAAGRLSVNPCSGLRIARRQDRAGPPPVLTPLQALALLLVCSADEMCRRLLGWLVECLLVGLRPENEAPRAVWPEIDFRGGVQHVMGYKRGVKPRHTPLHPTAHAWLRVVRQMSPRPVAPGLYQRRWRHRAVVLANAWLARHHPGTPPIMWSEDILRHTHASMRAAAGVPMPTVAADMGTSVGMVYAHYRHVRSAGEARRFWAATPARIARLARNQQARDT